MKKQEKSLSQNILTIDATKREEIRVGFNGRMEIRNSRAQRLPKLIEEVMLKNNISPQNISEIQITENTETITGHRIGLTVANIFEFLYKIPVSNINFNSTNHLINK